MESPPPAGTDRQGNCSETTTQVPLCVDLDGTLVKTNTLIECALSAIKAGPGALLHLPLWSIRGQAHLWNRLGPESRMNPESLPLRAEVLDLIRSEALAGREIVLVTGAHEAVATSIAERLGGFSAVLATSGETHLVGARKAELLVRNFGQGGFDYIGDSGKDLAVWRCARNAIVVNGSVRTIRRLQGCGAAVSILAARQSLPRALLQALRPHQWAKNLLVFVPLILGHKINHGWLLVHAFEAFVATCAAGSGAYLLNDLLDLEADRLHAIKRNRPFASGALPLEAGVVLGPLLLFAALGIALLAGRAAAMLLGAYLILTSLYSIWLKRVLAVDVILLSGLYCVRLLIGGEATFIPLSPWTVAFSMFLFLSLALMKRYSELHNLKKLRRKNEKAAGRSYSVSDMPVVSGLGSASGMTAVLVVALYVNGADVRRAYGHPDVLYLICVLILLWITRLWLIAGRGELDEDPVMFAIKDPWSVALGVLSGIALLVAL